MIIHVCDFLKDDRYQYDFNEKKSKKKNFNERWNDDRWFLYFLNCFRQSHCDEATSCISRAGFGAYLDVY